MDKAERETGRRMQLRNVGYRHMYPGNMQTTSR